MAPSSHAYTRCTNPFPSANVLNPPIHLARFNFMTWVIYYLFCGLGHGVQGRAVLEPLNLPLVECVRELNFKALAVLGVDNHGHGLANCELGDLEVNLVIGIEFVVVGGVREGEGKHTLLLQVGFVLFPVRCDFW